jgi:hypothetical protein
MLLGAMPDLIPFLPKEDSSRSEAMHHRLRRELHSEVNRHPDLIAKRTSNLQILTKSYQHAHYVAESYYTPGTLHVFADLLGPAVDENAGAPRRARVRLPPRDRGRETSWN